MWNFIQQQVLGMKWLNELVGQALAAIGLDLDSRLAGSLQFFIYDVIKILILLCTLIFVISYIQSYFPPEKTKERLGHVRGIGANTGAALLGTLTPFCACSSIPLFIGFTTAGLPVGVTFSFLISSPLVDLASLLLITSIFGFKVGLVYVVVGLILAVIAGSLIERFHMDRYLEDFVRELPAVEYDAELPEMTRRDRVAFAKEQVVSIFRKVIWYLLAGVAIGAVIHNWIPQEWVETVLGKGNPFSVILAALVGAPMYADIFGTLPIAEALFAKGAALGTVVAFMMSVVALSLPSLVLLKKVVKMPLLLTFTGIVTAGIILVGYLFNVLEPLLT